MKLLKAVGFLFVLFIVIKGCGADGNKQENSSQLNSTISTPSAQPQLSANYQSPSVRKPDSNLDKRYIGPESLNVRSAPNGRVVGTLKKLTEVTVYATEGSWIRINEEGKPDRWVSAEHLCTSSTCSDSTKWRLATPTPKTTTPSKSSSTESYAYGSSCACSSGSNCYGPRGGRYCITSGGNKRYR